MRLLMLLFLIRKHMLFLVLIPNPCSNCIIYDYKDCIINDWTLGIVKAIDDKHV